VAALEVSPSIVIMMRVRVPIDHMRSGYPERSNEKYEPPRSASRIIFFCETNKTRGALQHPGGFIWAF